jgi:putative transposase
VKKLRFSEQQIAFILRQAEEGTTVEEVRAQGGIIDETYYIGVRSTVVQCRRR